MDFLDTWAELLVYYNSTVLYCLHCDFVWPSQCKLGGKKTNETKTRTAKCMVVSITVVILPIPRNWASLWEKVALNDVKNQFILVNFLAEFCLISNLMHKILIYIHIIHLLKSSTCFEDYCAHLQEVYVVIVYMQPLVSSLCRWLSCEPVKKELVGWAGLLIRCK
jgi:hypothetical protein